MQQLPPTSPLLGGLPISTCHHGRPTARVHSHARGTHRVRTSNPGEPLQPGKPGYPASPCQTDQAGISMSSTHGKSPSIPQSRERDTVALCLAGRWMALQEGRSTYPRGTLASLLDPTHGFRGAKAKVLRLNKATWSRDLLSCRQCHRFHACPSHPETENRNLAEVISKDPPPLRHQPEKIDGAKAEADLCSFGSS